jgi:protocatechuate 3,4-dioxygenase beta subunit
MSKKNIITICMTSLILLGIPSWTDGQESNNPWFYSLLDAVRSSEHGKGFYRLSEYGRDNETLLRIIHNINKHIEEVERLRILGFAESEIQTYFITHPAGLGVGSISGRVRLKGEEPSYYPGIYVSAYNEYGYFSGSDYIFSSEEGDYTITGLLPGKYYLRASAYGYTTQYYRNTNDWKKAQLVRVKKGKNTGRKNFVLESIRGKGAISGQVKGKDGTPLSDCYVYAYGQGYSYSSGGSTNTDENGRYTIDGLKSGNYKLHCEYTGQGIFVNEWYKDEQSYESATGVTVTEPKITTGINFVLEYGGTIKGKVLCASGKKADAYLCSIYAYDESKYLIKSGITDENGKFFVSNLRKGSYKLYASYNGPENSLNGWYRKAEDFEQATPIHINPPEIKNVKIKLKPGGAISGNVIDFNGEPIFQNCSIEVYDENEQYAGYTWTDENGNYTVMRLRSGRYKLFAEYDDYYPSFSPEPMDEWYDGCNEYDKAAFVHVKASKTTPNINFSLEQGGSIGGTVYRKEGYPAYPDGWVSAYNLQGYFAGSCQVVSDGQYFIGGLPSGEYKLLASHYDYQSEWYDRKQNFEMAGTVNVTAPNSTLGIDFTLEYPSIIQGFLTDKKGHPLVEDDYLISMFVYDVYTGDYISSGSNSFTGGFRLRLLDGNYKLAAVSMYSNWQKEQDNLAATFYLNGKSFYDPNSQSINLAPESIRKLKDLEMNRAAGSITGTLYDGSTRQPLVDTGYMLFAFDEYGYLAKVSAYMSDDQPITGGYKLMGLRPGNYYVLAVVITEDISFLWYPDVVSDITENTFTPKVEIPAGAYIVIVGNGETTDIDFYFKGSPGRNE